MSYLPESSYVPTTTFGYSEAHKDFYDPPPLTVFAPQYGFQDPNALYPATPTIPIQRLDLCQTSLSLTPQLPQPIYYYTPAGPSCVDQQLLLQEQQQVQAPQLQQVQDATTNLHLDIPSDASTSNIVPRRGSKRGRPTKNPVWTFFHRIDDKSVQCNICGRLVKSACATNMSKHLERHHQNSLPTSMDSDGLGMDEQFGVQKYAQPVIATEYMQQQAWHPYMADMTQLGVSTSYDVFSQQGQSSQETTHTVPWSADRKGAKRNRRTKHPVWELFRRTTDGHAQCQLCTAVVRSPCSSNFMGHLNRHHTEHYQEIYHRWLENRDNSDNSPEQNPNQEL